LGNKTNVAIAAAVTAYSRMIINNYKLLALNLGLDLFYSDTDSLVLNGKLPPEHIDSATLGKLKLEHTIKEGIFVMPKVYYLEDIDGTILTKCKALTHCTNSTSNKMCFKN
jgi:DNA polymerase elongation subunit (family B)